jgi:mannose-6-phosphate isomerase-like protein (cupin superfamily)
MVGSVATDVTPAMLDVTSCPVKSHPVAITSVRAEFAPMKTRPLPSTPDASSPAGAQIRYLMESATGNMIHSTVPPGQVNRATVHATVNEFWYVLSGKGEIWRRDGEGEQTVVMEPGVSIDIPTGTAFQYRCNGSEPLRFICIAMPPWPGDMEATFVEGPWEPTAPAN